MTIKNRVGEVSYKSNSERMEIIRYGGAKDIDVLFDDGYIAYNKEYQRFKKGEIKNPNTYKSNNTFKDRTNEEAANKQGLLMRILNYRKSNDLDIIFQDGTIVRSKTYNQFIMGQILNNNYSYDHPHLINRVGETSTNTDGLKMKIIRYNSVHDIDIEFEDGFVYTNADYRNFQLGNIKNPLYRNVFGVGYLGYGSRNNMIKNNDGSIKQSYTIWRAMLQRSYHEETQIKYPTYKDCYVCDDWHCYTTFSNWYDNNYYNINDEKMCLDKDWLAKGNKVYSSNTCIFVPEYINVLITKKPKTISTLPIGISATLSGKFTATIVINGEYKHLGNYNTPLEAFNKYKENKESHIKQVADEYKDKIPQELYDAMYRYEVEITD